MNLNPLLNVHFSILLFPFTLLSHITLASTSSRAPIYIDDSLGSFIKDGLPFRYISGSFHYWRTPPEYWEDRLLKMSAAGLNAVQTYIPWHLHEPYPGEYRFDAELDVFRFLTTVQKIGLLAIIRPGPYIDNLNEFGGLPAWLLWQNGNGSSKTDYNSGRNGKPMRLRTEDPDFLAAVFSWFDFIFPKLTPLLYPNGGPIFAAQVENELGSYQPLSSEAYLSRLISRFRRHFGDAVVLFTTDGSAGYFLKYLQTPRLIFPTVDFGVARSKEDVIKAFGSQREALKRLGFGSGPLVNSEYYPGWHDYWGRRFISVDGKDAARTLDDILSLNASVNIFMFVGGSISGFHGGTTVGGGGFYYTATTTWDYDAPISEAGDPRKKLFQLREVIRKYIGRPLIPVPPPTNKSDCAVSFFLGASSATFPPQQSSSSSASSSASSSVGREAVNERVEHFIQPFGFIPLLDDALHHLSPSNRVVRSNYPLSFEEMRQDYGYVLYRNIIDATSMTGNLTAKGVRDRGLVYVNRDLIGEINRNGERFVIPDVRLRAGDVLDLLVENLGRKDYGVMADDEIYKGLLSNVTIGSTVLRGWIMHSLPLNDSGIFTESSKILRDVTEIGQIGGSSKGGSEDGRGIRLPAFVLYNFTMKHDGVDPVTKRGCRKGDSFFLMNNLRKGLLFLNGRNIGRYWTRAGPQNTLFVANPYLKFSEVGKEENFNLVAVLETDGVSSKEMLRIPLVTKPVLDGPWNPPNVT